MVIDSRSARRHAGRRLVRYLLPALVAGVMGQSLAADVPAPERAAHAVTYDRYSMKIDGKRLVVWSGSFHYWRLPSPGLWRDVLQKMKAGGYNAVEIYFHWGYHSPARGVYDFTGIRDVDRLLDMAKEAGIYVIARPGPYINAETDGGGFPAWLGITSGKPRSTDAGYVEAYQEWMTQIDRIIARHQVTNGTGTVLLYQVENEFYDDSADGKQYMQGIEGKARADGITVPLFGNHNSNFLDGVGATDIPGQDSYPLDFNCSQPERWNAIYDFSRERQSLTKAPFFFPEYQGGAFDVWGGPGYEACRKLTGVAFEKVFYESTLALGATMQNFYMTYGGINWGWLASPGVYTSYDYGAAIDVSRRLTAKYDQQKLLGYLLHAVPSLAMTNRIAAKPPTNPMLHVDGRVNPEDGTQLYILRHADATAASNETTQLRMDVPGVGMLSVPQQPGTTLRINGRDSKILLANLKFGSQHMVYSTSELMTTLRIDGRDLAVLHGRKGEDGETEFSFKEKPEVNVIAGKVQTSWDAKQGRLRLNYRHDGLARVAIGHGPESLLLLLADDDAARGFWQVDTGSQPVLVRGPYLVRSASANGADGAVDLTGDVDNDTAIEVFASHGTTLRWNGVPVAVKGTSSASLLGELTGPLPVTLPTLDRWTMHEGAPEAQASFDDSAWRNADKSTSKNPYWEGHLPILHADEYGFHHGNLWYRGHFKATGKENAVILSGSSGVHLGNNGLFTAWLNGHFLGSNPSGAQQFAIDPAWLRPGADNVISVLVDDMGHNQEEKPGAFKEPRGLMSASLVGSGARIDWKVQGNRGGEALADTARGPFNVGGLYGERMGWSLPGFPDAAWKTTALPRATAEPGVDWYRTTFTLDIPAGQDVPIGLKIDDSSSRHYRALVFINGWQVGRYINALGPQDIFELPAGLLNPNGKNTIVIASWSTSYDGGLGKVSLVPLGNVSTSLQVRMVDAPDYQQLFKPAR